jgi:hypothetical protein
VAQLKTAAEGFRDAVRFAEVIADGFQKLGYRTEIKKRTSRWEYASSMYKSGVDLVVSLPSLVGIPESSVLFEALVFVDEDGKVGVLSEHKNGFFKSTLRKMGMDEDLLREMFSRW